MSRRSSAVGAALLAVAIATAFAALAGCGGPTTPVSPEWKRDIRPLMVARCIRCHDSPEGHVDPLSKATGNPFLANAGVPGFNYQEFADIPAGALIFLKLSGKTARGQQPPFPRMPPPPAEALEDWQIEMLDSWAVNPR